MTPPLTAKRALEMAQTRNLCHEFVNSKCSCGLTVHRKKDEAGYIEFWCPVKIALLQLHAALAEAGEEVCVCGHPYHEHSTPKMRRSDNLECYRDACNFQKFISRAEFLREQIKELEVGI